jgi:hypothetical protein
MIMDREGWKRLIELSCCKGECYEPRLHLRHYAEELGEKELFKKVFDEINAKFADGSD